MSCRGRSCRFLRWQELARLRREMISGNVTSGKPVERQRAWHYKHKAPLLQCCFSRSGYSLLYLLEAKCQSVSALLELAERKSSQCQMLKSPGLQGAFSNHLQERVRKAPATGCRAEQGLIPASVCQPAANGRRRAKTYLGNPPSHQLCHESSEPSLLHCAEICSEVFHEIRAA